MRTDRIVRRQGSSAISVFLLAQLLLLAIFTLTTPPVRAAIASTVTVESAGDTGGAYADNCPGEFCSLRDAVAKAASGDTIIFDQTVFSIPVTITLQVSRIIINKTLTIDGSTAPVTPTISGPGADCIPTPTPISCFNVFDISGAATNVTLNRLKIVNGRLVGSLGAGIYNAATLTVTDSVFENNITTNNPPTNTHGYGGALANLNPGNATVVNSTFLNNSAVTGGGIYASAPLTLTRCVISGNNAENSGGGILAVNRLVVMHSIISGNTAGAGSYGGGLYYNNSGVTGATLENSIFSGNSAGPGGGGIAIMNGAMTITNSTFWSNNGGDTGSGGAIISAGGTLTLLNSTLSDNRAGSGGGIWNSGTTTVKNTIIAKGMIGANCHGSALAAGSANNMNDDTTCGSSFSQPAALLLGSLGNYGGSTETIPLLPNSPAIDAGSATGCPATDQRGVARVAATCDIGAFESQGFSFQSQTGTPQSAPPNTAFATLLGLTVVPTGTLEPVDGGQVVFNAPSGNSVPSTIPIVVTATIAGGHVSQLMAANGIAGGPYNVIASARGAPNASFVLMNGSKVLLPLLRR
jgi:hypothetical protein